MPAALKPGELGKISVNFVDDTGRYLARASFKSPDGTLKGLRGYGTTEKEAKRDLKQRHRAVTGVGPSLTRSSSVADLAIAWLADKKVTRGAALRPQSLDKYESDLRNHIVPRFRHLRIKDASVPILTGMLKALAAEKSAATANRVRSRLLEVFRWGVQQELLKRVLVDVTPTFHHDAPEPAALTDAEVLAIRAMLATYRQGPGISGPRPDGQTGRRADGAVS